MNRFALTALLLFALGLAQAAGLIAHCGMEFYVSNCGAVPRWVGMQIGTLIGCGVWAVFLWGWDR